MNHFLWNLSWDSTSLIALPALTCVFNDDRTPKCSLWNIECGDAEYVHRPSCKYPSGCHFSGWSEIQCGMAMALTKKYQKKLVKFTKLVEIVTSALAVFKTSISKALNDGKVDEQEFSMLQTYHLGVLNELANVDPKMEAEMRAQLQKSILEEINDLKKAVRFAL